MATNGGSARDAAAARRRRIAERGAERLALITGRDQSVSSSPPPPSVAQYQPSTAPCPPSVFPISDQLPLSDKNNDFHLKTDSAHGDATSDIQPVSHNSETITETSTQTSPEPNKVQSFPATLTEHDTPTSTSNNSQKPQSQTRLRKTFSPNQLGPAITASQDIRIICSIITALLVLFSDAGFPIVGSDILKKIILFRPLFLLIATNITIIAAHFLLKKIEQREHRGFSTGESGFTNHIGMLLEWGLLMKTGLSALFMDCSVYSVVVVCGMAYLRLLGL